MSIENDARLYVERYIVETLIDRALAEGWKLDSVFDSEEYIKTRTREKALDAIFAVDESTVRFTKDDSPLRGVFIVLGNGCDVISDYSAPNPENDRQDWNGLMDRVNEWVDAVGEVFGA